MNPFPYHYLVIGLVIVLYAAFLYLGAGEGNALVSKKKVETGPSNTIEAIVN
jgi:hypothetical protein